MFMLSIDGVRMIDTTTVGTTILRGIELPETSVIGLLFYLTAQNLQTPAGLYLWDNGWVRTADAGAISYITAGFGLKGGGGFGNIPLEVDPTIIATQDDISDLNQRKVNRSGDVFSGNVDMDNNFIKNVADPFDDSDASNKRYTDLSIANSAADKLSLTGGSMKGYINLHADPVLDAHAVRKIYVDNLVANADVGITYLTSPDAFTITPDPNDPSILNIAPNFDIIASKALVANLLSTDGGTMYGPIDMEGYPIRNSLPPDSQYDYTNKAYVDQSVSSNGLVGVEFSFDPADANFFYTFNATTYLAHKQAFDTVDLGLFANAMMPYATESYVDTAIANIGGGGGGGSADIRRGNTTANFGSNAEGTNNVTLTITVTGITSTSVVQAWLIPTATVSNSVDDCLMNPINVMVTEVYADTFKVIVQSLSFNLRGLFNIGWMAVI
jgi:hypothetical protein